MEKYLLSLVIDTSFLPSHMCVWAHVVLKLHDSKSFPSASKHYVNNSKWCSVFVRPIVGAIMVIKFHKNREKPIFDKANWLVQHDLDHGVKWVCVKRWGVAKLSGWMAGWWHHRCHHMPVQTPTLKNVDKFKTHCFKSTVFRLLKHLPLKKTGVFEFNSKVWGQCWWTLSPTVCECVCSQYAEQVLLVMLQIFTKHTSWAQNCSKDIPKGWTTL